MSSRRLYRAAGLLASADRFWRDAALVVEERRVSWVGPLAELPNALERGAQSLDLGDVVLTPGLVNAHAHLELGALFERCPPGADSAGGGMLPWIGSVLREKATLEPEHFREGVASGAKRLLETGTTSVGDIDSSGAAASYLAASGLRGRVYREVLDGHDAARTAEACARLPEAVTEGEARRVLAGVSPHAPHTVSRALMLAATQHAQAEGSALSVHFAESEQEVEWLATGSGAFASVLGESPRCTALESLEGGGLARAPFSLVHANHMTRAELERVVSLGGVLVHCPGTHEYFGRARVSLAEWREAGAVVALGSDSLASNADLDLRREMALVSREHPELGAAEIFRMATEGGAAALGLAGELGVLERGAHADFVAFDVPATSRQDALEALTRSRPAVRGVWVGGEQV